MSTPDGAAVLPAEIRDRLRAYTTAVDGACPGRLEGLYVVGSVALGDYRARFSNVDVVAVAAAPWTAGERAVLRRAQRALDRGRPAGAVYVTWDDLANGPAGAEGELANPVTWRILRDDAMVERGPDYPVIRSDDAELVAWARRRFRERWAPWLSSARRRPWTPLVRQAAVERVLSAAQLFRATQGFVQGKAASGRAVQAELGPARSRILRDAVGYREGSRTSMYWGPLERRRDLLGLVAELLDRVA